MFEKFLSAPVSNARPFGEGDAFLELEFLLPNFMEFGLSVTKAIPRFLKAPIVLEFFFGFDNFSKLVQVRGSPALFLQSCEFR